MALKRVGVFGSGIMGSGIAEVVARSGFEVSRRAGSPGSAERCMAHLARSLGRQVDRANLGAGERDAALSAVALGAGERGAALVKVA